ncbi:MAG: HlyD family type I secretion periplasmic adaptor subunit [Beijerinckiaceae bacterium]|nr:HlyD family type I secretion periplasmic adaptor subunit [Beijerinckiaceae bacterium]
MASPPASLPSPPRPSDNWSAATRVGYLVSFGLFGGFLLWTLLASVDGAAVAHGVVSAEGNRKTVQHLEGGIVQEILVRDGQSVKENELLLRIDPTRFDSQNEIFRNQLAISLAQEARLLAEFNQADEIRWPQEVLARANDPAVAPVIADQKRLFESRRNAVVRNIGIGDAQIEQTRKEIEQARNDMNTARATLEQVNSEYEGLVPLFRQKLVPVTRMAPLERERLRLQGIVSGGEINITKLQDRIGELELRRQQILQDYKQEASTLLVEVRKQINDQRQQMVVTSDQQKRAEIRAPISGTVQQMRIFTVGGVIRPGDPILDIAPENDDLVIRAKVSPNDIDRVAQGARAEIKFSSLRYFGRSTIYAKVRSLSRDRQLDEISKEPYFAAELVVDNATLPDEIRTKLVAGINAEVFIITGERSVASYLLQPITDRYDRSMRER